MDQYKATLPHAKHLQSQIDSLQLKINLPVAGDEATGTFGTHDKDTLDQLSFEVLNTHGGLATLCQAVQEMKEKEASGGEIECHGVSFGSMLEAVNWFDHHGLKTGMFADAKALLHCIQPSVVSQEWATKNMESQKKIDIDSNLEATIITSFDGVIPPVLAGSKTELEGGAFDCLLAYQKSFEKWNPPGHGKGLKRCLSAGIRAAQKRIQVVH